MGCLCGCGADNQHCYLPNRPPSPNTFFENFYAPTFADLLESCLRRVKARREPSKRIKWRRTYGGDAQDESPPQHGKSYPRKGDRSYSPLPSPGSERIINEQSYDNSISQRECSNSNRQFCSGLYSPPLDLYARQVKEDTSQTSRREAEDSWLQDMGALLRRRAGLDGPSPPNVKHSSLESQNERFNFESLPKLVDHPLMTMQPRAVHESARGDEQPSNSHKSLLEYMEFQLDLDVPAQPEHSLTVQPLRPEINQSYPRERSQTESPKPSASTDQATIRQELQVEEMQGSVVRRLKDEQSQPSCDHMACFCGLDTHEHLHNLPHRPPLPNTLLEHSWTSDSVQLSVGGEAQDTIPRRHKWVEPARSPDESRGRTIPSSRLPAPSPNETEAEVKHDSLCDSKISISRRLGRSVTRSLSKSPRIKASECREAQKGLSLNNEKGARIPLPPTKAVIHLSSSGSQDNFTSTLLPNAFNLSQPVPALSMKPSDTKSFQFDRVYLGSRSAPIYGQQDQPKRPAPVQRSRIRRRSSQASPYPKWTKKDTRRSVEREGRALDLGDRFKEQAAISRASSPKVCLCGCGGDNLHCLRPSRPPSPNTFYENFWAPNFADMLMSRLDNARRTLEPSKRIWWREEFGGCAPDREPLDSEIWGVKGIDLGNVLRTSPPPSSDDNHTLVIRKDDRAQSPGKRQYSTSPHETPIRSADEAANTLTHEPTFGFDPGSNNDALCAGHGKLNNEFANDPPKSTRSQHFFARTSKPFAGGRYSTSPTDRTHDPFNPFAITSFSSRIPPLSFPESPSEDKNLKFQRQLEAMRLRESQRLGMNEDQRENAAVRDPNSTVDQRSFFHAPTVRPTFKSPKSPTHYIPDRLPPLKLPDFSKPPVRHKRKVYTAEEDEELLQSTLRLLQESRLERYRLHGIPLDRGITAVEKQRLLPLNRHAEELPSHIQTESLTKTAEDIIQVDHPLYEKAEAMKLKRRSRHGTATYQHTDAAAEDPPLIFHGDHVDEVLSDTPVMVNSPSQEERQRWRQLLYHRIKAMKLNMNLRQGATIYRNDDAYTKSSPPNSPNNHDEEAPLDTQVKEIETSAEEHERWRQSIYQKLEAMKLRRKSRQGIAIYRDDDTAFESSSSTSSGNHVETRTNKEEHQLWRESLYQRIQVMKLRRNERQRISVYRHNDTSVDSSALISVSNHLDMEIEPPTDEQKRRRQSLYQRIAALKLRINGRCGTSIYRRDDTAVESSNSRPRSIILQRRQSRRSRP